MIDKNQLIFYLILIIVILILLLKWLWTNHTKLKYDKRSQSVRYGKAIENFLPFIEDFPYDYHNFRFLGNPIDGIQFNEDGVVFIEFKGGSSGLSEKQRNIKDLILNKRVYWKEIRI